MTWYSVGQHRAHLDCLWQVDPVNGAAAVAAAHAMHVKLATRQSALTREVAEKVLAEFPKPSPEAAASLLRDLVAYGKRALDGASADTDEWRMRERLGHAYVALTNAAAAGDAAAAKALAEDVPKAVAAVRGGPLATWVRDHEDYLWPAPGDTLSYTYQHIGAAVLLKPETAAKQLKRDATEHATYNAGLHRAHLAALVGTPGATAAQQEAHEMWVALAAQVSPAMKAFAEGVPIPSE